MSHTMWIPGDEDEPKVAVIGNSDFSGDMKINWVEGDGDKNEVFREIKIPGEVLQRVAKFMAKRDLEERLMKFLEEV